MQTDTWEKVKELNRLTDIVMSRIPSDAPELEKLCFIASFITEYFESKNDKKARTMFDFCVDRTGVCRDYARFFEYLCQKTNVDCKFVYALPEDKTEDGHAWNIAKLDGKYYHIDVMNIVSLNLLQDIYDEHKDTKSRYINSGISLKINRRFLSSASKKIIPASWNNLFLVSTKRLLESNKMYSELTKRSENYTELLNQQMYFAFDFECPNDYPREKIKTALENVSKWNDNYYIHHEQLAKLFKARGKEIPKLLTDYEIEKAMPNRSRR